MSSVSHTCICAVISNELRNIGPGRVDQDRHSGGIHILDETLQNKIILS